MIKLTLEDGFEVKGCNYYIDYNKKCIVWIGYKDCDNVIKTSQSDDDYDYFDDIKEISKQGKFITNEEMIKLGLMLIETYVFDKLTYVIRDKKGNEYSLDDYIDITSIVKGE